MQQLIAATKEDEEFSAFLVREGAERMVERFHREEEEEIEEEE